MLNFQKKVSSLVELKKVWEELIPKLQSRCIVLLDGDIGAGKTTSVQLVAETLKLHHVHSPSFAIHNHYKGEGNKTLDHLDLYRLVDDDDLESSGFWDLFSQDEGLIFIEWAQRLNIDYLPMNWQRVHVKIDKLSEVDRLLTVTEYLDLSRL